MLTAKRIDYTHIKFQSTKESLQIILNSAILHCYLEVHINSLKRRLLSLISFSEAFPVHLTSFQTTLLSQLYI